MNKNQTFSKNTKKVTWRLGDGNKGMQLQGTIEEIEEQLKQAEQKKVDQVFWVNQNNQADEIIDFEKDDVYKITREYYIANIRERQCKGESCRVRQALHCVLLAIDFLDTQFHLGISTDRNTLIKKINEIYKYVAEKEGIKKETISSKLITQTFASSDKFIDALQAYYDTKGKNRTLEIEISNHVSKASKETISKDIVYVRDRFNEIRQLYNLNQ